MPGCVLRAYGDDFDVDAYLDGWNPSPCEVWRKGIKRAWKKEPPSNSGFNLIVSEEDSDLSLQIDAAIRFIILHAERLSRLSQSPGLGHIGLDFGIFRPDRLTVHSDHFPSRLIILAAGYKMEIVLSQYFGTS